jgi:type I restriction enzyme, R subunit
VPGKTFTACTLSYRLLAHAGFRRIPFLADRANLVRQTRDEFLAYRELRLEPLCCPHRLS